MRKAAAVMTGGRQAIDSCWVVTDGKPGMEVQCLGLAEALGVTPEVKRIRPRAPWRWLPPTLWHDPLRGLDPAAGDRLVPPWPALLIATGRQTVAPALAIREAAQGDCFVVQIQNPTVDPARFDLVVAPAHDRLSGANVIVTRGALNRITPARLAAAAAAYAPRLAGLPRPLIAVLVGGDSKVHRLPPARTRELAAQLVAAARACGGSLLVTPSRRTGPRNEAILREALAGVPGEIWDHRGDNPYFAYLGLADFIVVTGDSVNMVCEAASSGVPVHVAALPGGSDKQRRFHEDLAQAGITRPFSGSLQHWRYTPLAETQRVAEEVARRFGAAPPGPIALSGDRR